MKITLTALSAIIILIHNPAVAATYDIWPSHDFDTRMNNLLNTVQNFDTIHIHGTHTYETDVGEYVIDKDITITGDGLGATRIKRVGTSKQAMFKVTANGVTFENLTINCNQLAKQGVFADGVSGLSVVNVAVEKGFEGSITSTGLPARNGSLCAIYCTEGESLPDLRLADSTFKNFGWAGLYLGSGHGSSAPLYTNPSYGGYFVIDNCRFKRTTSSFMRMGVSIDYGEDKLDVGVDFSSSSNPVTGNRTDQYDDYGFIGNSTFDQMIFYSMAISRSKKLWIDNNDLRGGDFALAQADAGRFTSTIHLENNCVSFYITNNTIIDMGEYSGIEITTFFANDGNDHCKWIFIEDNLFDGDSFGVTDNTQIGIIGGPTTDCYVRNNTFNHNNTHSNGIIVGFWPDNSTSPPSYASSYTKTLMTGNTVNGTPLNKDTQVALPQP